MTNDIIGLRAALVSALRQATRIVALKSSQGTIPQLVWKFQAPSGWMGTHEQRPQDVFGFSALSDEKSLLREVEDAFEKHMPGVINRPIKIGGLGNAYCKAYTVLTGLVSTVRHRHDNLVVDESGLTAVVDELLRSIESRTITFGYLAPIRNFKMRGVNAMVFPNGVCIRQLTESEANRMYGGMFPVFKTSFGPPSEFAFAGEFKQPFGFDDESLPPTESARALALEPITFTEQVMMAYKTGPVVHDWISISFAKPSLTGTLNMGIDASPRPTGESFELTGEDVPQLSEQFDSVRATVFPALPTACRRLAESQRRSNPIDAVMDAVIGLEMLLLGGKDREGLRFRFALNYATLCSDIPPRDRKERFKAASDLYRIRSQVVHAGVSPNNRFALGQESLTIGDAAKRAKEMLRTTINAFLRLQVPSRTSERERWLDDFWERGYFGLR